MFEYSHCFTMLFLVKGERKRELKEHLLYLSLTSTYYVAVAEMEHLAFLFIFACFYVAHIEHKNICFSDVQNCTLTAIKSLEMSGVWY